MRERANEVDCKSLRDLAQYSPTPLSLAPHTHGQIRDCVVFTQTHHHVLMYLLCSLYYLEYFSSLLILQASNKKSPSC